MIHIRSSEPFIDMILLDSYDPVTGLGLGSEGSRQDRPIENRRRGRGGLVANVIWLVRGKPRSLSPNSKAKQAKKRKSQGNSVSQYSAGFVQSKITAAFGKAAGTGSWAMKRKTKGIVEKGYCC